MKNLNFGILVDQVVAECDFCGEKSKKCFRSSVQRTMHEFDGFEQCKKTMVVPQMKREDIPVANICEDCVEQMAEMKSNYRHNTILPKPKGG